MKYKVGDEVFCKCQVSRISQSKVGKGKLVTLDGMYTIPERFVIPSPTAKIKERIEELWYAYESKICSDETRKTYYYTISELRGVIELLEGKE